MAKATQLEADEGVTVMVAGQRVGAYKQQSGEKSADPYKSTMISVPVPVWSERASFYTMLEQENREYTYFGPESRVDSDTRPSRQAGPPGAPPPPDHRVPHSVSDARQPCVPLAQPTAATTR